MSLEDHTDLLEESLEKSTRRLKMFPKDLVRWLGMYLEYLVERLEVSLGDRTDRLEEPQEVCIDRLKESLKDRVNRPEDRTDRLHSLEDRTHQW